MRFQIIASKKDIAGINIAEELKKIDINVMEIEEESIYADNIDKIDTDFIIFTTRHAAASGKKSLSVHAPGNWHKAEFGGESEKICNTSAIVLKELFIELNKQVEKAELEYEATLECTHHGPLILKPCCFIEIGSSEEQWKDKNAGKVIALTLKNFLDNYSKKKDKDKFEISIGMGGPHYCPNFNKIQLKSSVALSHIIPIYALPLTEKMLNEAISKTKEKVDYALLDWKGIGNLESRNNILDILKKKGLKYKRTSEINKSNNQ